METLLSIVLELTKTLEDAKSIPHTSETLSQRRDVLRKCNKLRDKLDEWNNSYISCEILGDDVAFTGEEVVDEFYPTPQAVEKTVEEYGDKVGNMLFEMHNIEKAAEKHGMSESFRKRMESAFKLMCILSDYLDDTTCKY